MRFPSIMPRSTVFIAPQSEKEVAREAPFVFYSDVARCARRAILINDRLNPLPKSPDQPSKAWASASAPASPSASVSASEWVP